MKQEEIQELRKAGLIETDEDLKIFEKLYDNLGSTDENYRLKADFAHKMGEKLINSKNQARRELTIIYTVIALLSMVGVLLLAIFMGEKLLASLSGIAPFLFIFVILFLLFTWLEKKMIKN